MPDFKEVFGDASQMACASVKITTKRYWVRLVHTRHDVQLWVPDDRVPGLTVFTRKYNPASMPQTEHWIARVSS